MKASWKSLPLSHKIVTILSVFTNLCVVVLSLLQLFDVWDQAINLCIPMMGGTLLCQAHNLWNRSRTVAYFSLGTAIIIFICAAVVFFI